MSDDPVNRLPAFNRVSIRAVLVTEGEDATEALMQAGFSETISIPVVLGDDLDLAGGILGNGITPNLTALLETEHQDAFDAPPGTQPGSAQSPAEAAPPSAPATANLPAAFGIQPLAPVRKRGT
jgi:hypothetical protein